MELVSNEFNISQADSNVTKSNGTAGIMSDIFDYKVPDSTIIQLRPSDVIAAYFKDASAEMAATDAYEIVVTDPNRIRNEVIASGLYMDIKTFDDRNKVRKFGQSKTVKAGWHIFVRAKATTVLVNASCYFKVTALRLAEL
jgi:hypothetical protein